MHGRGKDDWHPPADLAIYCNRSNVADVVAAMGDRPWMLWLATLDGTIPHRIAGRAVDAVQYAEVLKPWHMDLSKVLNPAWRAT